MAEAEFYAAPTPLTLGEIAALSGAKPVGDFDPSRLVSGAARLEVAGPIDVTFISAPTYLTALAKTRAAACFCLKRYTASLPQGVAGLETPDPQRAFALVLTRLYPDAVSTQPQSGEAGISPKAQIHPTARIEDGVTIESGTVVGPDAEIGRNTRIGPHTVIGPSVRIGRDCDIAANVSISYALIGNRVTLQPGVRIGQGGFGFVLGQRGHTKVPQIGRVIIQDDVDIGANSAVDRGSLLDTVIGEGTKIDNLVQIAHNVVIGRHCLIAGMAGIAGSAKVGDFVLVGGQAGIRDHVVVGDYAQIAAAAAVMHDVPTGGRWYGVPAQPFRQWARSQSALNRISRTSSASVSKEGD